MSRKAESLTLPEDDYWKLRRSIESKFVAPRVQLRARILLGAAEGLSNHELAIRFSVSRPTVMKWRRHYATHGLDGLFFPRASADRRPALRKETEIINCALGSYPRDTHRWTVHGLARELHVSRKTVQRTLKNYRITPRMLAGGGAVVNPESLILSVDPLFGRRIVAVAGLYYNMWDRALAFAVAPEAGLSEDRLRLDGGSGLFDAREIDALMAALNAMDTVKVFSRTPVGAAILVSETEVAGFLKYLNHLDQKAPAEHDVHLIMQWYGMGVHRNLFARDWLSAHPRFQPHFVPRIMTWLRLVECWLDLIQRSGRDTPVLGVKLMVTVIDDFVRNGQGKAILGPWAIV